MIHVLAIITAKPGQRENILAAARANVQNVRAEDGCSEYNHGVDAAGLGRFQTSCFLATPAAISSRATLTAITTLGYVS